MSQPSASAEPVYVLGGAQTDFARNWAKQGGGLADMLAAAVPAALADASVDATAVEVLHVGNLAGELFAGQAQLGGLVVDAVDGLDGVPSTRHEAACASGSAAVLAACADLQAGRYDLALVVGVEQMRNVDGHTAAAHLGTAAWAGHEALGARFPWPALFAEIADAYDARYGLHHEPLGRFAELAFTHARRNPLAQARDWSFPDGAFGTDDTLNPPVEGHLRKTDCGRITDGAVAVLLASPRWLAAHRRDADGLAAIAGFGHRTAPLPLARKLAEAPSEGYLFPQLHAAVTDAYRRSGVTGPDELDVVELHDCFSITALVTLEHLGLTQPGKGAEPILDGSIEVGGRLPVNPGGGLLASGHPVGATGVRMLLDLTRQVTGTAGEMQIPGARTGLALNVGGSFTTAATTVVRRGR